MSTVGQPQPEHTIYRTDVMIAAYAVALLLLGLIAARDGVPIIREYIVGHPFESIGILFFPRLFAVSVEQFKNRLRGEPMYVKDIKWLSDNATYNLYTVIYPAFILICLVLIWQTIAG
jgi:hypothetical protein